MACGLGAPPLQLQPPGEGGGGDTGSGRGGGDWAWLGPAGASCHLDRASGESAPSPRAQPKPGPAWSWATRPRPRRAARSRAVSAERRQAKALLQSGGSSWEARAGAPRLSGQSRLEGAAEQEMGLREEHRAQRERPCGAVGGPGGASCTESGRRQRQQRGWLGRRVACALSVQPLGAGAMVPALPTLFSARSSRGSCLGLSACHSAKPRSFPGMAVAVTPRL